MKRLLLTIGSILLLVFSLTGCDEVETSENNQDSDYVPGVIYVPTAPIGGVSIMAPIYF